MIRDKVVPVRTPPSRLFWWIGIPFLILLVFGCFNIVNVFACLDGCGPYRHSSSVADFDADGDLDVVFFNLRHESDTIVWAGPTLWLNQGGGRFTRSDQDLDGGLSGTAGDVDGDGSADILTLGSNTTGLRFYLNHGGIPGWDAGIFRLRDSVHANPDQGLPSSVVLGDLDNDGDLDGFVAGCCGMFNPFRQPNKSNYPPSFSWMWINERNQWGRLENRFVDLRQLGDLSMRAVALGDLDGDGDLDAFAAVQPPQGGSLEESSDRVLLNDGDGSFTDSGQRLAVPVSPGHITGGISAATRRLLPPMVKHATSEPGAKAIALGDLDHDGDLDAVVGTDADAFVWMNQGGLQGGQAGIFADSGQHIPGDADEAIFLADLDGDGDQDALLAGIKQAAIWWNDGRGVFAGSGQRLDYSVRHGFTLGDFDGDGDLDAFAAAAEKVQALWLNDGGKFFR